MNSSLTCLELAPRWLTCETYTVSVRFLEGLQRIGVHTVEILILEGSRMDPYKDMERDNMTHISREENKTLLMLSPKIGIPMIHVSHDPEHSPSKMTIT